MASSISASMCSPTSLQLRLAMNAGNCRPGAKPSTLIRARVRSTDLRVPFLFAAPIGDGAERRRVVSPCAASGSAADGFAGWSDSDNSDRPIEAERNKWLGGALGAGLAGVVLFAGVTFVALSLSKRSTSRPGQGMEPLTAQQEMMLTADKDVKVQEPKSEESIMKVDDSVLETDAGLPADLSSSPECNKSLNAEEFGGGNGSSLMESVEQSASHTDTTNNASTKEDLQYESSLNVDSNASDLAPNSLDLPNSEIANNSLSASLPDSSPEIGQHSVIVETAYFANKTNLETDLQESLPGLITEGKSNPSLHPSDSSVHDPNVPVAVSVSISSSLDAALESGVVPEEDKQMIGSLSNNKIIDLKETPNSAAPLEVNDAIDSGSSESPMSSSTYLFANEKDIFANNETKEDKSDSEPPIHGSIFSSSGIPAPSVVPPALQGPPGKVLVPAVVDQVQGQTLTALQTLKVIEADVQPTDICTRREYARWLVAASSALSRNTLSKVYPAMYIENITELAFDDITPDDPDFSSIQGLAEAGLISSKLSNRDLLSSSDENQSSFFFSPESPLSRQDLVSWKMALEKQQLPEADRKILYQLSGFRDVDRIHPDAWPALVADLSAGDQGIISLAFGCTRLFQPDKPVTKAQAAVALATGEYVDIVGEELTRIEADSVAENAVSAHNALVAHVEREMNAHFEKELLMEREKTNAVEKMAEKALQELETLRAEREQNNIALMKEHAAVESEMELLAKLRREVEEQLESLLSNKVEILYEKERISKLQKEAELEKQEISRLQYELEVERKALSMARAWAEDEAKRAREQAKALEEARDRWERHGIKVVVDNDLREESTAGVTWLTAGNQVSVDETVNQAENLVDKLKLMADEVRGKSREVIQMIMQKILSLISMLKNWTSKAVREAENLKDTSILKAKGSFQELQNTMTGMSSVVGVNVRGSMKELQQSTADFSFAIKEGTKRVAEDCRDGVEKLTQKFKS